MKQNDNHNRKKKSFIRMPSFPGGKDAYLQFIKDNIIYPPQAIENKIEGHVHVRYTVNNIGQIEEVEISKGIGYGCDEEAIRVIRLLQYEPARNRGIRMKVEMKTRIHFQLPKTNSGTEPASFNLNYSTVSPDKKNSPEQKPQAVYNYSINLGNS